jgi:hypothetical protein
MFKKIRAMILDGAKKEAQPTPTAIKVIMPTKVKRKYSKRKHVVPEPVGLTLERRISILEREVAKLKSKE